MRATWTAAVVAAALGAAATAQTDVSPWSDAMRRGAAAFEAGDLEDAYAAFEQGVIATEEPTEETASLRALAIVRLRQERPNDVLALTERALGLVAEAAEANAEDALWLSSELWSLRADAFSALGRDDARFDAAQTSAFYSARLPQPGWRVDEEARATHLFSGFTCPLTIADLPRSRFTTFSANGADVGCAYSLGEGAPAALNVYFTHRQGGSLESSVDAMRAEIDYAYGSPPTSSDDERPRSDGATVRRVIFERGNTRLPYEHSGGWLTDVNGWTSKIRISWAEPLDAPYIERLAESLAIESARSVWLGECAPATERATESNDSTAGMAASLLVATAFGLEDGDQPPIDPRAVVEADACWIGAVPAGDRELVVRRLRVPTQGASHVAASIEWSDTSAWFGAFSSFPLASGGAPAFVAEVEPERVIVWATLEASPSDQQFAEIVGEILRGERRALSEVRKNEEGVAINIDMPE